MYDTFIAMILVCGVNGSLDIPNSCSFAKDKMGPVATVASCHKRLDALWGRMMADSAYLVRLHDNIGPFKLSYPAHRGYCISPVLDPEVEIKKYYSR